MREIGLRVVDLVSGEQGTVVRVQGEGRRRRYQINWDDPTPYQDQAWTEIPSRFFDWAPAEGTVSAETGA